MIQLYKNINRLKVLTTFLDNPYEGYYIREIARLKDISPMTVKRAIDILEKDNLLIKKTMKKQILFYGNIESPAFRHLKISYSLSQIEKSGLIDYLVNKIDSLSSMVIFGSYARGEDDPESDIDIMIITSSKMTLDLRRFERKLSHRISIKMFKPSEWDRESRKNKAFYVDVITEGIVLHGRKPVIA